MRYSIFGESHGSAIGVVLEDVPSGLALDLELIAFEMARRAPGKNAISTTRQEGDAPEILSGWFNGKTTGTPLCAVIRNTDQHSGDYTAVKDLARPGHGDFSGFVRYHGCNDYRGGGHFSGRLTAPLVFAGAVAKQILARKGIYVGAHIRAVGPVEDVTFLDMELSPSLFSELAAKQVTAVTHEQEMYDCILAAREAGDSVGGAIECAVIGLRPGLGAPDFGRNVEGIIAQHMFAVPAVKGIEFGTGFGCVEMPGSAFNDEFYLDGDAVRTHTNHSGGINGGITNGMPVVFTVAMRPTPSISKPQHTVDLVKGEETILEICGRHDPCVVPRAVPVIEAAAALAICELLEGESKL